MSDYATNLSEGFAQKIVKIYFERSVADEIANHDYEGEIKDQQSKVNILTFGALELRDYTGADMADADDPQESVGVLETTQKKVYYFKIKSLDKFKSWIKNPEGTLIDTLAKKTKQVIDTYVLGLYADVAAGNRVGTDYATGTVTIDVTTGAVTGSGTTFTAAMVGKGFWAEGLEDAEGKKVWYRVKSYASATSIVIENDSDDEVSAYTGGAIAGGSAYIVQANTKIQVTKDTIYAKIVALGEKLDEAEIPEDDRWLVVPPKIHTLLVQAGELTPAISEAYQSVVKKGYVGDVAGFMVFKSNRVAGNNDDGFHVLAGHKSWVTLAMGFVETGIEDLQKNFGKAYKGLTVYGAKVVDERRKAAAELFCYV